MTPLRPAPESVTSINAGPLMRLSVSSPASHFVAFHPSGSLRAHSVRQVPTRSSRRWPFRSPTMSYRMSSRTVSGALAISSMPVISKFRDIDSRNRPQPSADLLKKSLIAVHDIVAKFSPYDLDSVSGAKRGFLRREPASSLRSKDPAHSPKPKDRGPTSSGPHSTLREAIRFQRHISP